MDTGTGITNLDWMVLFLYAAFVVYVGVKAGRNEKTTDDYFLGGRQMPWWAVMISIYATSLSALTFIGVPGAAYGGDFRYLQLGLGDLVGRLLIAFLLLSAYYKTRVATVYEFLGQRFGPRTRDAGSGFFIVTRLLASGVRLAGCAIALSVVFKIPVNGAIIITTLIAVAYTMVGGIKAVIWTDTLQFFLFIGAAVIAIGAVIVALPEGWSDFVRIGLEHEKFKVFHISFTPGTPDYWLDLSSSESLIAGMLFGCLSTLAALGTDQDLVQRMLTCKDVRDSQKALILTAILNFPVTLLFLTVGAALFVYFQAFPDPVVAQLVHDRQADRIFPYFIKTILAPGFRGLLIAGLLAAAMSSLDSALNALSASAYLDIFQRHIRSAKNDRDAVKISRRFVVIFAILLAGIAIIFARTDSILWLGFRIVGYTYGAMLGIVLLAVITKRRGRDVVNVIAMVSSVIIVIVLTSQSPGLLCETRDLILQPLGITKIAWPWAIAIGTIWTFTFAALFPTQGPETRDSDNPG